MAITPQTDGTLEDLLIYLKTYLNQQAAAYYTLAGQPVQTAVNGLDSIQSDLSAVSKFPLLMGYRTSWSGEQLELSQANLDYFLLINVSSRLKQDAMFNWVAKHMAIALDDYSNMDDGCFRLIEKPQAKVRYAPVRGKNGPITIPFLQMPISFEDYDSPV